MLALLVRPLLFARPRRVHLYRTFCLAAAASLFASAPALAQERPYFVTYDHYLEETGSLEVALASTTGAPRAGGARYVAPWLEVEYGVSGWWTTELYLEGVATSDGAIAGWRWENRFRPLRSEHRLNPVLYVEYERLSEASRIQKEVVGRGSLSNEPIPALNSERAHEIEAKLILSSTVRGWNLSENVVFEKNLSAAEGVEFGYSVGVSRSLGGLASERACTFCRENFTVGAEAYGGLGSTAESGLAETRHFLAPVVAWHLTGRTTVKASVGFGLTEASDRYLVRLGCSYELPARGGRR